MRERELSELEISAAFEAFLADAPTEVQPAVLVDELAQAGQGGRLSRTWWSVLVPNAGRSPAFQLAWLVGLVALLLGATISAVYVGSQLVRRADEISAVEPAVTLTLAHPGGVSAVAWSPDGTRIVTAGFPEGTVRTWDATSGEGLVTLWQPWVPQDSFEAEAPVAYSPDGTRIAAGMKVYDGATGEVLLTLSDPFMAWSPDGTRIATSGDDEEVDRSQVCDAATGEVLLDLGRAQNHAAAIAWSPDGARIATAESVSPARIWDASTGDELLAIRVREHASDVAWSPDGTRIATAESDPAARIVDAATGDDRLSITFDRGRAVAIAWSPDGTRIATANDDWTARIWDADSGVLVATLSGRAGHAGPVTDVAWSPDGTRIVTVSSDGTAKVWQVPMANGERSAASPGLEADPWALDPAGGPIVSDTALGTITWQLYRGSPDVVGTSHGLVGTDDAGRLAWLGPDGTVERMTLPAQELLVAPFSDGLIAYGTPQSWPRAQAWRISWDGNQWVVGDELDVPPYLVDSEGNTELRVAAGPRGVLIVGEDVAVASDGQHFVTVEELPGGSDSRVASMGPVVAVADGFLALVTGDQIEGPVDPQFEPIPWFSADGLAWEPAAPSSPFGDNAWIREVAGRDGRFVAVGNTGTVNGAWAAWVSDDFLNWERLSDLDLERDRVCLPDSHCPIAVTAGDAGWVIATGVHQSLWASADGRTWEPLAVPGISIEEPWGFMPVLALGGDTIVVLDSWGMASAIGTIEP